MRYLHHESGEAAELRNTQVLGDDSPLPFGEEGRAGPIEDELAEKVSAMHRHVSLGRRAREPDGDADDAESAEGMEYEERIVNAETLVQEHWQSVVSTIEAGDADDYLEELEAEEQRRDSPRESVIDAIDERQE